MKFPFQIIDLSQPIYQDCPSWEEDAAFTPLITLDYHECAPTTPFRVMKFITNAGIGTHLDAPGHCVQGSSTCEQLDLNNLCMPAYVIDLAEKINGVEHYVVEPQDIEQFEKTVEKIQPQSAVLIRTGWSSRWNDPKSYRNNLLFPSISQSTAHYCIDRDIRALGIDTLSPDAGGSDFSVHQLVLKHGIIIFENITNLERLPVTGSFIMGLPLKIVGATESPIRLIGLTHTTKKPS